MPHFASNDLDFGGSLIAVTGLSNQQKTAAVRPSPSSIQVRARPAGWTIHDEGTKHTFSFPSGFRLTAGGSVTVRSGGPAGPGGAMVSPRACPV